MEKVYCKECSYFGKEKHCDGIGSWFERVCVHVECFQGEIGEVDTPVERKKVDRTERILNEKQLNADNNCTRFEKKRWIDFLKKESQPKKEETDISVQFSQTLLEIDGKNRRIKVLEKRIKEIWELLLKKDKIIVQQDKIIFKRLDIFPKDKKKKTTVFDKIDLD